MIKKGASKTYDAPFLIIHIRIYERSLIMHMLLLTYFTIFTVDATAHILQAALFYPPGKEGY